MGNSLCFSNYQVVLNDGMSTIRLHEDPDEMYTRLAHMPLQTPGPVYKLSEIVSNIHHIGDRDLVSFVAAVRLVSTYCWL